jgi:predicted transcriptional regulator
VAGDDAANILISIREEYVARILAGKKSTELRCRAVNVACGSRVWIYTKKPSARIAVCASVREVIIGHPTELWKRYGPSVGITREEFNDYLNGRTTACCIVLSDVRTLSPALSLAELRSKSSSFHPPQFFKRLLPGDEMLSLLQTRVVSKNSARSR